MSLGPDPTGRPQQIDQGNPDLLDYLFHGVPPEKLAQLDQMLGIEAPVMDATQETAPQPSYGRRFLEGLGGLPPQQGGGLLGGLVTGLGGAGQRSAMQRAKLEAGIAERQRARDAANQQATAAYRAAHLGGRRMLVEEALRQAGKEPPTTDEQRRSAAYNTALGSAQGRAAGPAEPVSPGEARAAAAAERAVEASERANRLATVTSTDRLIDNYNQDPDVKAYRDLRSNLSTARAGASQKNGVGDLAMIFAYARSMEPGSVNTVREGEVSTAREAVGRLASLKAMPRRYISGDSFTDEGRSYILRQIESGKKSREPAYNLAHDQYRERATAFGVDPKLIIRDYSKIDAADNAAAGDGWRPKSWQPVGSP